MQAAVPNRKVFVYNNIFYNPAPTQTLYTHFNVEGPSAPPAGFRNFPTPSKVDDNLVIRGNIIWNGPPDHPIGIEDSSQGCQDANPTCFLAQLKADNAINKVEPLFVDPAGGNFHPIPGGNIFSAASYAIPDFTWSDAPALPFVPQGILGNTISVDRDNNSRTSSGPPGAYVRAVAMCDNSTLSADLKLHVPVIRFGEAYYEADFDIVADSLRFRLKSVSPLNQSNCSNPALLTQSFGIVRLYIPVVTYGGISYWLYLQYEPGNGSTDMIFALTSAGAN